MDTTLHPNPNTLRAFAAIDLDRLRANFDALRTAAGDTQKILAVVKAGAYGHNAIEVAAALKGRADFYGVATATEGVSLRVSGIDAPILIFGRTPLKQAELVSDYRLTQCVFSYDYAAGLGEELGRLGKSADIHLKLDTGMGRLGFRYDEEGLVDKVRAIAAIPALNLDGVFSHYAKSDVPGDPFTALQTERFTALIRRLEEAGIRFAHRHMANSAATLLSTARGCNMVRGGICLYGDYPSEAVRELWEGDHPDQKLSPVMRLCASVAQIRHLKKGEPLGYDCAWIAPRDTTVAVVAAGYADGVPRAISGKADAIRSGCPIIGNICMDMTFVDITDLDNKPQEGDIVPLFGDGGITASDWARAVGTITYEIYCNISARIPRVTYEGGQVIKIC